MIMEPFICVSNMYEWFNLDDSMNKDIFLKNYKFLMIIIACYRLFFKNFIDYIGNVPFKMLARKLTKVFKNR